jgi:threonine/homoserine/homoserine lactone efflux protein
MNLNYVLIIRAIYTGLITGIVIAIPMGPAGFESVRWTISKGFRYGVKVAAGSLIADAIDVMLINFGLLELLRTNKMLEIFFWEISGVIIFYIGYKSIKHARKEHTDEEVHLIKEDEKKPRPVFTGFIVNFSNPMTHFFWLTLSSTVISIWRSYGKLVYFIFSVFMLCGMFASLWVINYLASHGRRIAAPKASGKAEKLLSYVVMAFGAGFLINGIYKLYLYIK